MTKFIHGSFTVTAPGTDQYRDNFDKIDWGKKSEVVAAPLEEMRLEQCQTCGVLVSNFVCFPDRLGDVFYCLPCLKAMIK